MDFNKAEILETIGMSSISHLDIRTVTMGISLFDCSGSNLIQNVHSKILKHGKNLVTVANEVESELGIKIVNKRISLTPISLIAGDFSPDKIMELARVIDQTGEEIGVDYIGGFSSLIHKGFSNVDRKVIDLIPEILSNTQRICSSVSLASTKTGINMDGIFKIAQVIKSTAEKTSAQGGLGCAKLAVFANVPEDNQFIAGSFLGVGEPDVVLNVGISGPGVVLTAVKSLGPGADFGQLSDTIKRVAFKITRAGEFTGRVIASRCGIKLGIVDISLAPTPVKGDSVGELLEAIGLEKVGAYGTTAGLAMLNDAVKKGGAMACRNVGGLSGAFIPVAEDSAMVEAVEVGALSLNKLEAMTCVCSVGLDMIAIPGDTSVETITALIADEMAIGVINNKTTSVRVIPVPGKSEGGKVEWGGLLGTAIVQSVGQFKSDIFARRGGHIPPPIQGLTN